MARPQPPLPSPRRPEDARTRARRWQRELTAGARALPDFLIAGAMKAGTTSLYDYLSEHPQVLRATSKEIHYFSHGHNYRRGWRWYRAHFPKRSLMQHREERLGRRVVTGEASPGYLFRPHVPQRIARDLPEAKLIVLLRDPVARAYSQYQHYRRLNRVEVTWEEAIANEEVWLRGEWERMLHDETYDSVLCTLFSFKARGLYAEQLERLFAAVGRERVLVLKSEDLFAEPQRHVDEAAAFLGLEPTPIPNLAPRNVGAYRQAAVPHAAELRAFFAPHNARLYALLDRDFGW